MLNNILVIANSTLVLQVVLTQTTVIYQNSPTGYISRIVDPHNDALLDARHAVFQVSDIRLISGAWAINQRAWRAQ